MDLTNTFINIQNKFGDKYSPGELCMFGYEIQNEFLIINKYNTKKARLFKSNLRDYLYNNQKHQTGGGNDEDEKNQKYFNYSSSNGYKYTIFETDICDTVIVMIFGYFKTNKKIINNNTFIEIKGEKNIVELSPCITLYISKTDGIIQVSNLLLQNGCFNNRNKKIINNASVIPCGSELFKTGMRIINNIYKNKYNIKVVILTDKAEKEIDNVTVNVANLYTLIYGSTFYAQESFIPYLKKYEKDELYKLLKNNYTIITHTTIDKSNISKLYELLLDDEISKLYNYKITNKDNLDIEQIISYTKNINDICNLINFIKTNKDVTLKKLFNKTYKMNKKIMANILNDYKINDYLKDKIHDFYGASYYKYI